MGTYRCPSGDVTSSTTLYLKEWHAITEPIEAAYGLKVIGFDPHILMTNEEGLGVVDIPLWFAKRLVERLDRDRPRQ